WLAAGTGGHPASRRPGPNGHERVAERAAPASAAFDANRDQVLNRYANLPVAFVENRGQTDSRVRYYAPGSRYAFYLARDQVVLSFVRRSDAPAAPKTIDASFPAPVSISGARRSPIPAVVPASRE